MSAPFTLGILGPGTLGLSTAQWAAECGLQVRLYGRDRSHATRGLQEIERRWELLVRKGRLSSEQQQAMKARLEAPLAQNAFEGVDALLEALPEDPGLKAETWKDLAPRLETRALALTGSSSLPVGAMARASGLEGRLIGFHLFVPVGCMTALELVVSEGVPQALIERAAHLGSLLRKRVVPVKDVPGYAAARMALALGLEAMRLLEEGVADAEGLDALMTGGYGHPMGPLALSDRVGLDLRLAILRQIHASTGEARFHPPEILEDLVAQGRFGRSSGQGFHSWPPEEPPWKA